MNSTTNEKHNSAGRSPEIKLSSPLSHRTDQGAEVAQSESLLAEQKATDSNNGKVPSSNGDTTTDILQSKATSASHLQHCTEQGVEGAQETGQTATVDNKGKVPSSSDDTVEDVNLSSNTNNQHPLSGASTPTISTNENHPETPVYAKFFTGNYFPRILVIKHVDRTKNIAKEYPPYIKKGIIAHIGSDNYNNIKLIPRRSSALIEIEVESKEVALALLEMGELKNIPTMSGQNRVIPVSCQVHRHKNQCQGSFFCDAFDDVPVETIAEDLSAAGDPVSSIYRITKNGLATGKYIATFNCITPPVEIHSEYYDCKVQPWFPRPRICGKCQGYNHSKTNCPHDQVCAKCGQKSTHKYNECQGPPMCVHCKQPHPSTSKKCPMYVLENNILKFKTENQVSFRDAREHIYRAMPETMKKIPKLQKRKQTPTTANIVASGPTIRPTQNHSHVECDRRYNEVHKELQEMKAMLKRGLPRLSKNDDSDSENGMVSSQTKRKHVTHFQKKQNLLKLQKSRSSENLRSYSYNSDSSGKPDTSPPLDEESKAQSPDPMPVSSSSDAGYSDVLRRGQEKSSGSARTVPPARTKPPAQTAGRAVKPTASKAPPQLARDTRVTQNTHVTLKPKHSIQKAAKLTSTKLKSTPSDEEMDVESDLKRGRPTDSDEESSPKKLASREKANGTAKVTRQTQGKSAIPKPLGTKKFTPITHKH